MIVSSISTIKDSGEAVEEALSEALSKTEGESDLTIIFSSSTHDGEAVAKRVSEILKGGSFIGVSTAGEYFWREGFKRSSMAVITFRDRRLKVGVGYSRNVYKNPVRAGEKAIERALIDLGDGFINVRWNSPPTAAIIMFSAPGMEGEVMRGIRRMVGVSIPIFGGSSGDDFKLRHPFGFQIAKGLRLRGGVVIAAIHFKGRIGIACGHAYKPTRSGGLATETRGRRSDVLSKIDEEGALKVYSRWLRKDVEEVRGRMMEFGLKWPLGVRVSEDVYAIKHPASVRDDGIVNFASIPEGSYVNLMKTSVRESISVASKTLRRAIRMAGGSMQGGILVNFAGRHAYLSERVHEVHRETVRVSRDKLIVGFNSYGEQWPPVNSPSIHSNLTLAYLCLES